MTIGPHVTIMVTFGLVLIRMIQAEAYGVFLYSYVTILITGKRENAMKKIFETAVLGNLRTRNRVVRSATLEIGYAENGVITPELADQYADLTKGEVGLIITGMMGVGKNSCYGGTMPKIYHDSFAERFGSVSDTVHGLGGKLVVQLGQCGAKATEIDDGEFAYAPSDIEVRGAQAKAMTKEQIAQVIRDFGDAALTCKGADGVQIHGAHGYLLSEFLSPYFNKRTDEFGGPIENRARIVFAVYEEIRKRVGHEYPVLIKINSSDLVDGGLTEDECAWVCKELSQKGIDAIEISGGVGMNAASSPSKPAAAQGYFADSALRIAAQVDAAIISVGGYRTANFVEEMLNKGRIEAVSMCRPFIRERDLVTQWKKDAAYTARCISCSKCFGVPKLGCALD